MNKRNDNNPHTPKGGMGRSVPKWKPERFEKFWAYYRRNVRGENRSGAVKAWDKLKPDNDLIAEIGRALEKQMATEMWRRGVGIPYASTYLNGRRWEEAAEIGNKSREEPQHRYLGTQVIDGREVDVYG